MTEKQADHLLEMLDRLATAVERLVQLEQQKRNPFKRTGPDEPPAWTKNLPPRDKPPDSEL